MKCLLCGQTMKTVLTFSSLLLLRNDDSCLCSDCDSTFERIGEENCPNCMKQSCQQSVKIVNFGVKKELKSVIERFLLTIKL